jgi:uncharacterized protein
MIFCLWMGSSARALTPEVKDTAGFFSAAAVEKANREIAEIERKFKRDLLIETFPSVPADKAEQFKALDKRGRDVFFQKWAVERFRNEGVNGVYVLITKNPGHIQVEVGAETQKHAFTVEDGHALRDKMLAAFKQKEHDRGLEEGVTYVQRTMATNLAGRQRPGGAIAGPLERVGINKNAPIGGAGMSWVVWLIVIVVGLWIVMALLRGITRGMGGGSGPPAGGGYGGGYPGGGGYGGGGGGGGFMSGMLGGLFGAAAGNWLYDSFGRGGGGGFGGGSHGMFNDNSTTTTDGSDVGQDPTGIGGDFEDSSGADSGGDFGGDSGGDSGGGDFGGGDFGGGDFGGGDLGGGDF